MILGIWRDDFPRVILMLSGISGPLEIEFIVDTGFGGDLIVPENLLRQLKVAQSGKRLVELAGGFWQQCYSYDLLLEWNGEPRLAEVLTLDGNPLIGNALWKGEMLQAENLDGGEVLFEAL